MDHDAAHKYIYSLPETVADLLRLDFEGESGGGLALGEPGFRDGAAAAVRCP